MQNFLWKVALSAQHHIPSLRVHSSRLGGKLKFQRKEIPYGGGYAFLALYQSALVAA